MRGIMKVMIHNQPTTTTTTTITIITITITITIIIIIIITQIKIYFKTTISMIPTPIQIVTKRIF